MPNSIENKLNALINHPLPPSRWFEISQDMINAHADISQDWQYIHIDPEKAAETPFGSTIAHGFLTLSLLSAMAYDAQPKFDNVKMSVNYGLNHLRFIRPVPAGGRIRAHFTLSSFEEIDTQTYSLIWATSVELDGQDKPALAAQWVQRLYME